MSEQPGVADRPGEALRLGIVPLRPLTLSDLVSGTIEALRRNKGALFGVGLLVAALTELVVWGLVVLVLGEVPGPLPLDAEWSQIRTYLLATLIRLVVIGVLGLVVHAVVNAVVPRAVFGHTVRAGAALRAGAPRLPALLGALALTSVLVGALAGLTVLSLLTGVFALLLMVPPFVAMVYLAVAFLLAPSAIVVEGAGPVAALHRSRQLVHAVGWWRVFGVMLLSNLVVGLLSAVVSMLFDQVSEGSALAESLAAIMAGAVLAPAALVLQSLLYVDHRCRSEGIEGLWRTAG